ncbi:hypothetical protein [Lysobacter capsici]|uniref:hypothetical protein n=1 Tax=Lysobacter capsici TaxID=435897 RepID=UPI000BBAB2B1|nr:hypothetical protein [Lysobacter capsici]ATE74156.1 hypothetical protein CNO08_24035 [Lysobacter capsici]
MKQVTKTLLMLALVAASAFTIGGALARPPGGGTLPPQPPQPPIGVEHDVWTCYYHYEIVQFETPCPTVYNGKMLLDSFYGPPRI